MTRSPELDALLRRARRTRLARLLAAVAGGALGLCIALGVRITSTPTPAHAARAPTLVRVGR